MQIKIVTLHSPLILPFPSPHFAAGAYLMLFLRRARALSGNARIPGPKFEEQRKNRTHRLVMGASSPDRCAATTTDEERRAAEEPLGRTAAAAAAGRLVKETVRSMTFAIGKERRKWIGIGIEEKEERVRRDEEEEQATSKKRGKTRTSIHNSKKKKKLKKTRPLAPRSQQPCAPPPRRPTPWPRPPSPSPAPSLSSSCAACCAW